MISGHLQEKQGKYYMVISYKDELGKRKAKWKTTKLPVKGNKKRAEKMLQEELRLFEQPLPVSEETLFADFLENWLKISKATVELTTYASYAGMIHKQIAPYFRERNITLVGLQASDLQDFYTLQLERVKASTVIHYHAPIRKALQHAVKTDRIPSNPADKIERPKKELYQGSYYSTDEMNQLIAGADGTEYEVPILLGAFYGLRRSEVLGLKWDAIDFENDTITVRHIVTICNVDGKTVLVQKDRAKNKSSLRTLPLVPVIRHKLLELKARQDLHRKLCGKSYNKQDAAYICVDPLGTLISPKRLNRNYTKLLRDNNFRHIRFHDLRHSCASLLLKNGVPMKQIQEWLGHSDFSTTANIYAHLDYSSKVSSAQALASGLTFSSEPQTTNLLL